MGHSALNHIEQWASGGGHEAQFKLFTAIQANLIEARQVVDRSGLSDEAKAGLYTTIDALIQAFSLGGLQHAISNHLPSLETALTIFAVVTSAVEYDIPDDFGYERDSLVRDLRSFIDQLQDLQIDERLRDVARRQIYLLIALLKNAEAVGVETALASYYELLIKLRNRSASSDDDDNEDRSKFWTTIKSWSDRLDSLSKIYDIGQKLIPHVDKIPQITGF